jgi:hypothetical protein
MGYSLKTLAILRAAFLSLAANEVFSFFKELSGKTDDGSVFIF